MQWNFRDSPVSVSVLTLIISWNLALAFLMARNGIALDEIVPGSLHLYMFAAIQSVLVLFAYLSLRRTDVSRQT